MKNKRWKREAKRMKGDCSRINACYKCGHETKCWNNSFKPIVPETANIRTIEKLCKGK